MSSFVNGRVDRSGITLQMVEGSSGLVKRRAGVYLLGTGGMVPAKKESKFSKESSRMIPVDDPHKVLIESLLFLPRHLR